MKRHNIGSDRLEQRTSLVRMWQGRNNAEPEPAPGKLTIVPICRIARGAHFRQSVILNLHQPHSPDTSSNALYPCDLLDHPCKPDCLMFGCVAGEGFGTRGIADPQPQGGIA